MSAQNTPIKLLHSGGKKQRSGATERDLETYRDISDDVIESDFVPYACLLNADTLATKNGEVLQILKITGLSFDSKDQGDLRAAIRAAVMERVPDTSYAIWLHTLRRRQSLVGESTFPDTFSTEVDNAWRAKHPTQASFVNELYVTVVKAAQQANIKDINAFFQSLWPPRDRSVRTHYIERAVTELVETVGSMLEVLRPFGARVLTTVERNGVFYGEHLEFLEKLINLESRPMEIPRRDLSHVLTSGEITFGYNAMEVRTAEDHRRFAAILTLKEYKEASLPGIDRFLEIPCELIVTQCFDFVGAQAARSAYQKQAKYLAISGDAELTKWVEIDRLSGQRAAAEKAFGEQQTLVFIIAPSVKQLEANLRMVHKALARLGIVAVREDLRMEDCYWSQLPSNFPFVARKHSTDTQHIAGFANLQHQPMGNAMGSAWGPPAVLFSTAQGTPYFFNFQRAQGAQSTGHTIILGRHDAQRTAFTHFLIAQARKLKLNVWYFDTHGRAEPMVRAMGGQYVTPGTAQLKLNPFALEATPTNNEFLSIWFSLLIDTYAQKLNTSSLNFFRQLVDALMKFPTAQRRLSAMLPIVREQDPMLGKAVARWAAGGEFGEIFDMPADQFAVGSLMAWNLSPWAKREEVLVPLVSYLLHRATAAVAGAPTLIVLDEGFHLLKSPLFGPRVQPWLDYLSRNNAAVMLTTGDIAGSAAYNFTPTACINAASIFALGDPTPGNAYAQFGMTEGDLGAIAYMHPSQVLLKRGGEATLLSADLWSLPEAIRDTLSGGKPAPSLAAPKRAGVPA